MNDTTEKNTPPNLSDSLSAEHRELEKEMRSILECVHSGDSDEIRKRWKLFSDALLAHLDEEEREFLPTFEHSSPALAAKIREEHARIRAGLEERAVEIELHTLRENKTTEFIELLRQHAAREESSLYSWANRAFADGTLKHVRPSLTARLRAALQAS